jgi:glycosyltransferase involved in cell wall biosynthesis
MWNFILAIDELGPADLIVLADPDESTRALFESTLPKWSIQFHPIVKQQCRRTAKVVAAVRRSIPSGLADLNLSLSARATVHCASSRQLIVAIQPVAYEVARRVKPPGCVLVVDLWDVEDALLQRAAVNRLSGSAPAHVLRSRWNIRRNSSDLIAWRKLYVRMLGDADCITVCSTTDQGALPASDRVVVVPNGANVRPLAEHTRSPGPPTVLFHGQLTYAPNVDAAHVLVRDVLPVLQTTHPDVELRLVGRADDRLRALHHPPEVSVTGFVDDMDAELRGAWLLVVPLRSGGGTRLKILEAFAHGLPVVSTTIGAEGLGAQNATHLLIADDAAGLAAAVAMLLDDDGRCRELAAAAYQFVVEHYDWANIRRDLTERLRVAN